MDSNQTSSPAAETETGLGHEEAAERLRRYGPNVLAEETRVPVWRRVLAQLRDPLILVLIVAAALTTFTGDLTDTAIILFVIVVNSAVGVVQEVRAEQAVAALKEMSAPTARVVRGGQEIMVPSAEVVPGDLLLLAEGDIVPADGTVLRAVQLLVDESAITGESVPVDKGPDGGRARRKVSAGTVVVRGRGRVSVTATGASSATGRIAALLGAEAGPTPLQRRLAQFGRVLAVAALTLCALVMVLGLLRGQPWDVMVVTAITLAVAAVPESLPAVVTLALALGARRMAVRQAIVRRLPAVETLGSVTVIATDKTGTLTEGTMSAERLWTPTGGAARITGGGYGPDGQVERHGGAVTAAEAPDLAALLTTAVLCNDAGLQAPDADHSDWQALGDPTEAALLTAGSRFGLDRAAAERELPRVHEVPFDSLRKRMATVHRRPGGGLRVLAKGAPEAMLVPQVLTDPPEVLRRASAQAEELAAAGFRVLAVAAADRPGEDPGEGAGHAAFGSAPDGAPDAERWESGLALLGLVAILDPPRAAAAATVASCVRAGITPVMITGDHPRTARAVAGRLGIVEDGDDREVTTGDRVRQGDGEAVKGVRVFARTTPEQKLDIVQSLRSAGHVVAMTGDGVNDGPALRRADIGVAMGKRGTEVARQSADLVLADDDLGTVVSAVEEGRRIYANVRRFLLYGLAGGAAEILVMLIGPGLGMALPLLPAQILWINLLTHGLPGVALGAEPAEPDTMRRPPRPPEESVLGAGLWTRILIMSSLITAVSLAAAVWAMHNGGPWQTMLFLVLGATQLGVALGSRARPGTRTNPFLLLAVAAALGLQVAGVYLPGLQEILGTEALPLTELLVACALSAVGYAGMRAMRRFYPERVTAAAEQPSGQDTPATARG
ncbi:cation-translocating P-type ATPase [Streptomyces sodiiphilus]|uniref:Cation-translocating P-type ATPase n=1 Tax=Streptomyces sodiiphilus TaxID=226217 RepID=A0ABN2P516_9ACTN